MKYCVWNNKGGVGKSFITYSVAVEFAKKNPDRKVVVIDLCPQANTSAMILGGDGQGEQHLLEFSGMGRNGKTIAGYLQDRRSKSIFNKTGTELSFFVQAKDYNASMPKNLYLLPGDMELDICSMIIDYAARDEFEKLAWVKSRSFARDLIDSFEIEYGESVFFIDTNPSFANYTQLGIVAADRLLVPCTADSFSIRGVCNLMRLIYGVKVNDGLKSDDDLFAMFARHMKQGSVVLPKIHALVLNKSRRFDKKASKAWEAHADELKTIIDNWRREKYVEYFTNFPQNQIIFDLKDANTIATVLNNNGIMPSELKQKTYEVYKESIMVNKTQIDPYLQNLKEIIEFL
ncbi:MAG: ParA family protein [Verrucomicrobiales bacterium]|jgi:cellulose biosynthesis protein BcsQ|nr:ParA family protein [Verrucomicrobiales bacterium]